MFSTPEIIDNVMYNNTAKSGAGIGCIGSCAKISNNIIVGNFSETAGGGICCIDYSEAILENNWIVGNSTIWYGGGLYCLSSCPTLINNTIACNSSAIGGGIYLLSFASPTLVSNTITNNSADSVSSGIYGWGFCSPIITNSIIRNNGDIDEMYFEFECYPEIIYCNIDGGWSGIGNIDADPMFVLPSKRDFRLLWQSPCIDAGHSDSLDPDSTRSDIGAYFFDQNDYLTIYLTPDTTEIIQGGQLGVTYTIINRWAQAETFWIVTDIIFSNGDTLRIIGPRSFTIPKSTNFQYHITHDIPFLAPIDQYLYQSKIGVFPQIIYDKDSFSFCVTEP